MAEGTPSEVDIAWAAGLFDGEGCIRIAKDSRKRTPYFSLKVQLNMLCKEVLERFAQIFPGRKVLGPYTNGKHERPVYQLTYAGADAARICRAILPHLIEKKAQAEAAIRFWEGRPSHRAACYTPKELRRAEDALQELRQLKRF